MSLQAINRFILQKIRTIEMVGVLMRIFSFSLVSWLGPALSCLSGYSTRLMPCCCHGAPSSSAMRPTAC
jgi:hypothetical protein